MDWNSLKDDDIDKHAININTAIFSLANECIPNKHIRVKSSDPAWLTTSLKRLIRKRKRAYKKAKRTNSERHWSKFKTLRNKVTTQIRISKDQFYDKIAGKLKSETLSSKDWWATLKTFISPNSNSAIPPLETNGIICTDELEKANIFNNFFQSQTLLNDHNAIIPDFPPQLYRSELSTISLSPPEIESVLKILKVGKASGPNGLSNYILRELSSEVSSPLCSLFNQSLHSGVIPKCYKEANVSPVPKKGDLSLVSNYRPISLLNSESKVFEKLIFKYLYNHLQDNNMLSSVQSGFIPGDSTVNQLTYLYHIFCEALDSG